MLIYLKRTLSKGQSAASLSQRSELSFVTSCRTDAVVFVFRGFVSGVGVQTDSSEALHPLSD